MLLPSHLRISRHGVYYFRVILPAPIAAALGQVEFVRSLGIRCPKLAKSNGYQIWAQISPLLNRLARLMSIDPKSIDPAQIRKMIVEGLKIGADGSFSATRIETSKNPLVARQEMEGLLAIAKAQRQLHQASNRPQEQSVVQQAEVSTLKSEIASLARRVEGEPTPRRPATLQEAHDSYMLTKKGIAGATKKAYRESASVFERMIGGPTRLIHEITETEIQEFNEALALVPKHAKKRGIPITSAKEMLANPPHGVDEDGNVVEYDLISGATANLHCTNLQPFTSIRARAPFNKDSE
ncbi:MAG: hypothetical protein Q8K91_15690 [Hylemonella sp.]|nr:hypothetical protein [Hylemonella sp.]